MYSNRTGEDLLCWKELIVLNQGAQRAPSLKASLKIWLAFSKGDQRNAWSEDQQDAALAGIVKNRFDATVVARALCDVRHEPVLVVSSGPDGFFESMVDMLPTAVHQQATLVNLDD